jgi:Tfp pilus assembly protein PilF
MKHFDALISALLLCGLLGACATPPPPAAAGPSLLHDSLFAPPTQAINADGIFSLSDAMRAYAASELNAFAPLSDPRRALIAALYDKSGLRLDYDGGTTRNAAEAFEARAGNCLSLVIMTAAFAKHLGLPVSYQSVLVEDFHSRSGGLSLTSGHVNLVLERLPVRTRHNFSPEESLTVDFLPQRELRGQRTLPLDESRLVAMYMNNRAAESLAAGRIADGYWWARAALQQDPAFAAAANTLGVVYSWAGHPAQAEQALRHVLAGEPGNTSALSNLVRLLERSGRGEQAQAMAAKLARLQPEPPFLYFDRGRQAMAAGDPQAARDLFARELRRQPDQPEVHFWAALAHWQLGDDDRAARHLQLAMENSLSRNSHDRYAAKLDWLRSRHLQ